MASGRRPDLIESFKSNYERGRPPRKIETRSTPPHMGLSMYQARHNAEEVTRVFHFKPGRFVARMLLERENGFAYAGLAEPGHLTVWGRPLQLLRAVDHIFEIQD